MHKISAEKPRKAAAVDEYIREHFDRMKSAFDAECALHKDTATVKIRREVAKKCLEQEPEEFRRELEKRIDDRYNAAMEEYNKAADWIPKTAQGYHDALQQSGPMLLTFVDAIAQRLGLYTSLVLVGPMSDGSIDVKR
jgi:hypothetical protein